MLTDKELLENIASATGLYAKAVADEMKIEDNRIVVKMAAVNRIMTAGDNPLTGKPHSFSSAEALVNTDSEYAEYLGKLREATKQRILARGDYEMQILAAQLVANKR
jgi:hypothetical protein